MSTARDIAQALSRDPVALARALGLGEPTSLSRSEARYGRKGSLSIALTGSRAGLYCAHESGEGGDLLDLVKHTLGADMPAALAWARDYLGQPEMGLFTSSPPIGSEQVNKRRKDLSDKEKTCSPAGEQEAALVNKKITAALAVWRDAKPARGTMAEAYLAGRGLTLPADVDGRVVRFAERVAFRDGEAVIDLPALLTLMHDPATGEPCGVQRTPLSPDATKHPIGRRMRGRAGIAFVTPDQDVSEGLHLVEGLEDALAALAFGYRPAWAAMSAGAIESFPIIPGIECLTIVADGDDNGVGVKAAMGCAHHWREAGREARVKTVIDGDLAELAGRIKDVA